MPPRTTEPHRLDAAVEAVANRKDAWRRVPVADRIAMLRGCLEGYRRTAAEVVLSGCAAKGLDPRSAMSGEEWMSGPVPVIRQIRLLIQTLGEIERAGYPALPPGAVRRSPTGELAVSVFPRDSLDRAMYPRTRVDVWMQPGVDEAGLRETMAVAYRGGGRTAGGVALVLGAGNVASIAPTDVLYKLFVENLVVVLKMHPVNDYLGPLLARAFEPLLAAGYLRIVYGDAREGQYLVRHPGIDEIHMTGSTAVHDRIVWGDTAEEQARRRAAGTPLVTRRVTSELGCVTPVLVVPGEWSDAELRYQAGNVATMVAHSASCTCTSAKLLVTWRGWRQRAAFLDRVRAVLARYPPRLAYYPGAAARYEAFLARYPQGERLSAAAGGLLPCATIYGLDPSSAGDLAFCEESWSPVLAECALAAGDAGEFLRDAVRFANERVSGTLSVDLLVDPRAHARLRGGIDRAIADLRYGTVAVNHWSAVSFGLGVAPWGAYPGHTLEDVGSGIGVVHNTRMFARPLKAVLRGPFTVSPRPPWFITHRRAHRVGRAMADFEAAPALWRLPAVAVPALRP